MSWMHIAGFLLMLSGFLTVFENFWVALLLFAAGVVVFQRGIDKAAARKREEAEERWEQIIHGDPADSTDSSNAEYTRAETQATPTTTECNSLYVKRKPKI